MGRILVALLLALLAVIAVPGWGGVPVTFLVVAAMLWAGARWAVWHRHSSAPA